MIGASTMSAGAGSSYRVLDLDPSNETVSPFMESDLFGPGVLARDAYIFSARDGEHGYELWSSDGTAEGTYQLADLNPGPANSSPSSFLLADSTVYFVAYDEAHGRELWSTDGTVENTRRLTDLMPGARSSSPADLAWDGSQLFFSAEADGEGRELVVWNGTVAQVLSLEPGEDGADPRAMARGPAGGVYFSAALDGVGRELFFSDGTAGGTDLVIDIESGPGSSSPAGFRTVAGRLIFGASRSDVGREPMIWDPVAEVLTVQDLKSGPLASGPQAFSATTGGRVYFVADADYRELYESDGLTVTQRTDLGSSGLEVGDPDGAVLPVLGEGVCFLDDDSDPWCYEPSSRAQRLISLPGGTSRVAVADEEVWFLSVVEGAWQLWASDGTAAGTQRQVTDLGDGVDFVSVVESVRGGLLLQVNDEQQVSGLQVVAPSRSLASLSGGFMAPASSQPAGLRSDGAGGLLFAARSPATGREPWRVSTLDGTAPLVELAPGSASGLLTGEFLEIGDLTLITGAGGAVADEPYLWDGSSLQQVNLWAAGDSDPRAPEPVGDRVLLRAFDGGDTVLWSIDPITLQTEVLLDASLYVGAGDVAFLLRNGDLYRTDGSGSGTEQLIFSGRLGRILVIREQTGTNPPLVLTWTFGNVDHELWVSDGTVAGSSLLMEDVRFVADLLEVGAQSSDGAALLVGRPDGTGFEELFVSDGTPEGTLQITDRANGGFDEDRRPFLIGAVDGGWIYQDSRPDSGTEIWFTDGASTALLELVPGAVGSRPRIVSGEQLGRGALIDGELVFSAFTPERGYELWRTDGTVGGTVPLPELHPGSAGELLDLTGSGSRAYAVAHGPDGEGAELMVWEASVFADGFEEGDLSSWSGAAP